MTKSDTRKKEEEEALKTKSCQMRLRHSKVDVVAHPRIIFFYTFIKYEYIGCFVLCIGFFDPLL